MTRPSDLWLAYKLRRRRRRLLFRALRKRRQLTAVADRTGTIAPGAILAASTVRNEITRLPHFLDHYRGLGVDHFLFVDNGSDDGTTELLAEAPDVSLWRTTCSYRLSRFGMDWLTWLLICHGHSHWIVTVDADELLVYPSHDTRPLPALTAWLDEQGVESFGAVMLDLYPRGPLGEGHVAPGDDPLDSLCWFDGGNHVQKVQRKLQNLWIQGGVRSRCFFGNTPRRAPTLGKVPLVRWNRRFAYVSSTHSLLPRRLNRVYAEDGGERLCGVLLHTKFLPEIVDRSREEKARGEHFATSALYDDYYDGVASGPVLWSPHSTRLTDWRQLEAMGIMSRGGWT